jgi:hypothetical protein
MPNPGDRLLARPSTSGMSLDERGLLASMRWTYWTHHEIPATAELMAPPIGIPGNQTKESSTTQVPRFFAPLNERPDILYCSELEDYRLEMAAKRESSRRDGSKGGRSTWERLSGAFKAKAGVRDKRKTT